MPRTMVRKASQLTANRVPATSPRCPLDMPDRCMDLRQVSELLGRRAVAIARITAIVALRTKLERELGIGEQRLAGLGHEVVIDVDRRQMCERALQAKHCRSAFVAHRAHLE